MILCFASIFLDKWQKGLNELTSFIIRRNFIFAAPTP